MSCCGIRGATSVSRNDEVEILEATRGLLERMCSENSLEIEKIVSAFFTVTPDLNAVYPAKAAREIGWHDTALLCAADLDVPGSVPRCVRVLLTVNCDRSPDELRHVYLGEARTLRPDWAKEV